MPLRFQRPSISATATGVVALLLAAPMVAQRNRLGFDFWPDIVCQLFVGWRIAEGDALYTQIWESHPPAAVLLAAVPHLVLEPSYGVAVGFLVALALAVFASNLAFLRGVVRSPWFISVCVALLGAAFFYRYLIGARSEDVMVVFGTAALAAAVYSARSGSSVALPMLAGAIAGFGLLSKPGAIAAGAVAFLVVALCTGRRWRACASFLLGGALPIVAVLLWLGKDGLAGAYKNVVIYGQSYFRPFDEATLRLFMDRILSGSLPVLLAGYALAVVGLSPWLFSRLRQTFPALRPWQVGVLFGLLFVLWPLLELAVILPQTTLFAYVFFPFSHSLFLVSLVSVSLAPDVMASASRQRLFAPLAVIYLASLGGLLAVASIGNGQWQGILVAFHARDLVRGSIQRNKQTAALLDAAEHVRAERARIGGEVLWFDAAPGIAYFTGARNVIPEYISHPLFLAGFASEEAWQRVQRALDREDVSIVLVWPEWYNVLSPKGTSAETLAAGSAKRLAERYRKVQEFDVYPGRQPVQMLVSLKPVGSVSDARSN